jgi:D-3-phosphoglycerate dehydrogenase
MKVAVLDDYQDVVRNLECFDLLRGLEARVLKETYEDVDELAEQIHDVEAIVLIRERTRINQALLSKLPNLKLISQTGKISNHLDLAACTASGVLVAEGIGSPVAPTELCWALIMAASRHLTVYASNLRQGRWQDSGPLGLGRTLNGLTFGIWGYGKIGQRIAQLAKAFAMHVLVWGSESSRRRAIDDGFEAASSKSEFFAAADILSLHLRLNEHTRGCVRREDLALMKTDALFVNISRSELVEKKALYEELKSNPTKRAAIDVFDNEPAKMASEPLLSLPNVLCTPHLGYVEKNSYALYFEIAFENVAAFAQGKPQNIANGAALA